MPQSNLSLLHYTAAEAYMIFGGIPYYLSLMDSQYSLYQNIDKIYFAQNAPLCNEFKNLYRSLFKNADNYILIIETLAKKGIGLTRNELVKEASVADGGGLTKVLQDLVVSGFLREYCSFGKKKKDSLYQLVDFFSLFDIRFRDMRKTFSHDYWLQFTPTSAYSIWSGHSFEKLCLLHLPQIRTALGISGVLCSAYAWRGQCDGQKAQIDLIIDRNDNIINLCEIKFSSDIYQIRKDTHESLRNKRTVFKYATKTRKSVNTTMITTFGLTVNPYSREITSQICLDDLF